MTEATPPLQPESVWDYPRPPALEPVPQRIRVVFNNLLIAETWQALRVLETSHPPTYYIPQAAILEGVLRPAGGSTWCEFKGEARYFDVIVGEQSAAKAAWAYPNPVPRYAALQGCVAFYAHRMQACYVGDELVQAQQGGFYGGWITSNLRGPFKGAPGSRGW
jgi:uncharacterized protein (DUF427 family)